MPTLSVIIIAKDEADCIQRSLASASFADELIVIDSGSTDGTPDLARSLGAQVYFNKWPGYGAQKNFGASKAKSDWLLYLDADEEISPQLADQIQAVLKKPRYEIYWFRQITVFLDRPLYHLYGHNPRLIKKDAGFWNDASVHEQIIAPDGYQVKLGDNRSGLLTAPLMHYSHRSVADYLKTMHHYTTLDAYQMNLTGLHRSGRPIKKNLTLPPYLFFRQLFKMLFYRRGILDSWPGILWCFLSSYYEYDMARKFLKHKD